MTLRESELLSFLVQQHKSKPERFRGRELYFSDRSDCGNGNILIDVNIINENENDMNFTTEMPLTYEASICWVFVTKTQEHIQRVIVSFSSDDIFRSHMRKNT